MLMKDFNDRTSSRRKYLREEPETIPHQDTFCGARRDTIALCPFTYRTHFDETNPTCVPTTAGPDHCDISRASIVFIFICGQGGAVGSYRVPAGLRSDLLGQLHSKSYAQTLRPSRLPDRAKRHEHLHPSRLRLPDCEPGTAATQHGARTTPRGQVPVISGGDPVSFVLFEFFFQYKPPG